MWKYFAKRLSKQMPGQVNSLIVQHGLIYWKWSCYRLDRKERDGSEQLFRGLSS